MGSEKSARFNDAEKKYLEDKFNLRQQTGRKVDPERVVKDIRFAKKADGSRLFSSNEFLSAKQIQSFLSRMASNLRQVARINDSDIRAAQYERVFCYTRQLALDEVQLQHPIAYDNFNSTKL